MNSLTLTSPRGLVLTPFGFLRARPLEFLVQADTGTRWSYLSNRLIQMRSKRDNLSHGQRLMHMKAAFPKINELLEDARRHGCHGAALAFQIEMLLFPNHQFYTKGQVLSDTISRN